MAKESPSRTLPKKAALDITEHRSPACVPVKRRERLGFTPNQGQKSLDPTAIRKTKNSAGKIDFSPALLNKLEFVGV